MATHSVTHDGLDRVVDGYSSAKRTLPSFARNSPWWLFLIVVLAVIAASAVTRTWVQSIEGAAANEWLGVRVTFVLLVVGITVLLSTVASYLASASAKWRASWRAARDDQRLVELAKWDHRLAQEIRFFRSRD